MNVTIFKDIYTKSTGFVRPVDVVLERIKSGSSRSLIEKIRACTTDRNELKKKLPAICFSGEFTSRNSDSLVTHSGLICLDFDKFTNENELNDFVKYIKSDKYTFSAFISPGGNGVKVLVKIPPDKLNHACYFHALEDYYNSPYFDRVVSDVSRVCYESYDPELYYNADSQIWEKCKDKNYDAIGTNLPIIPVQSESLIIENLLKWFNSNYQMVKGERNANAFVLAAAFNDFGVSKSEAERILMTFQSSDFKQREIEKIIQHAYSKTASFRTKYFEDNNLRDKIDKLITSGKSEREIKSKFPNIDITQIIQQRKDTISDTEFWKITKSGKVEIIPHRFKKFLMDAHFAKYYPSANGEFLFIKIKENLVHLTNKDVIKDYVLNYLENRSDIGMAPYDYMANSPKYFKDEYLSFIDTANINLLEDTENECYLYFKNCVLKITANEINQIDYININGYVWANHVINNNYTKTDNNKSVYEKFLIKVAGNNQEKFNTICSVIGYLLHSYKGGNKNRAIINNDEIISDNPNGGSGKGIFCKAISFVKRMSTLDGKQFDFDKSFPYQTVGADTQILVFDDVKRNFAFENLFSLITEGITIERKRMDAIHIPVEKSPKIIINTNYTVNGIGGSFERRKFEIEFSSYFNANYTPIDEFNHIFFEDWNQQEWDYFYNFMISCVQLYLQKGIIESDYNNLGIRKFIGETSHEFYEWTKDGNLPCNIRHYKTEKFESFNDEYPDYKNKLTHKRFAMWCEKYATFKRLKYEQGKSQGAKWFEYTEPNKPKLKTDVEDLPF